MRLRNKLVVFCLVCLSCLRLSAQDGRNALLSLPPFERGVFCIKHFEGLHGFKDAPYVGYGHQLQKGERFTAAMTERQADSLLRADLMKHLMMFKDYGKDALLLAVLSYNVGTGRLLGTCQTTKGGVCPVLCTLISQSTPLASFIGLQGVFSCRFIRLSRYE